MTDADREERNRLILDILRSNGGKAVHVQDIAYLLGLDASTVDRWLRKHGFGLWAPARNKSWWRALR